MTVPRYFATILFTVTLVKSDTAFETNSTFIVVYSANPNLREKLTGEVENDDENANCDTFNVFGCIHQSLRCAWMRGKCYRRVNGDGYIFGYNNNTQLPFPTSLLEATQLFPFLWKYTPNGGYKFLWRIVLVGTPLIGASAVLVSTLASLTLIVECLLRRKGNLKVTKKISGLNPMVLVHYGRKFPNNDQIVDCTGGNLSREGSTKTCPRSGNKEDMTNELELKTIRKL